MASEEHLQLAAYIKNVHQHLRHQTQELGFETAWEQHCMHHDVLKKYAASMSSLATKHWEPNTQSSKIECRIQWVHQQCMQYFLHDGIHKQRQLEERKMLAYNSTGVDNLNLPHDHTHVGECCKNLPSNIMFLDLLDVGSCYNPFEKFPLFRVLPIDIAPAHPDVRSCDFLKVQVVSEQLQWWIDETPVVFELSQKSFDVVTFSLLLEYFPAPELRFKCCAKAYEILKSEGLLIIITPDSKHATANAPIMKKWRIALATLGFWRVSYEKLTHLHCMAYCKSRNPNFSRRWAEREALKCGLLQEFQNSSQLMVIPQDFNFVEQATEEGPLVPRNSEDMVQLFGELPCLD